LICGPLCALIWPIVRPRTSFAERPVQEHANADDAIAAASQLDLLGDWEAIESYRYSATVWPEHGEYIMRCVERVNEGSSGSSVREFDTGASRCVLTRC